MKTVNLNIYYQNARSIYSSVREVSHKILRSSYDIVIFTETWLKANVKDSEFLLIGYNIFRCDRSPLTSDAKKGGGVLIVVRSNIVVQKLVNPDDSLEQLFVLLKFDNLEVTIGSIYIPPGSSERAVWKIDYIDKK